MSHSTDPFVQRSHLDDGQVTVPAVGAQVTDVPLHVHRGCRGDGGGTVSQSHLSLHKRKRTRKRKKKRKLGPTDGLVVGGVEGPEG